MPGTIQDFAGAAAPAGWLLCFGQAVSRTTYAALFAAIGTAFGVGDGSTTFNLPDLRGRTTFGKDDMGGTAANRLTAAAGITGTTLGAVGGGQTVTLTTNEMPSHTHIDGIAGQVAGSTGTSVYGAGSGGSATSGSSGTGAAHQNIPPAQVVNKIIKF